MTNNTLNEHGVNRAPLTPEQIKALAIELAAAVPPAPTQAARSDLKSAMEALGGAQEQLSLLSELFTVISAGNITAAQASSIAKAGAFIGCDAANMADLEAERLGNLLAAGI